MSSSSPAPAGWAAIEIGTVFQGRYLLEELIGSGGFADVYRATQSDLDRTVALKILTPRIKHTSKTGDPYPPNLVERFLREAKLLSMLRDPHTITLYDFGRSQSGLLYMVFEYIDGRSLKGVIANDAPLAPARVAKILLQCLESLEEAHAAGVFHRDIKPGNIMTFSHLGREDLVKVLDFGIAKAVHSEHAADLTSEGMLVGTPRYMSPEQLRNLELTPASDIYSLGLVCYELFTGARAVEARDTMQIITAQLDPEPFRLPEDCPVPGALRGIVDRMMEKNLDLRYRTAAAVHRDLQQFIPSSGEGLNVADVADLDRSRPRAKLDASDLRSSAPTVQDVEPVGPEDDDSDPFQPRARRIESAGPAEHSAPEPQTETDGVVARALVAGIALLALFIAGTTGWYFFSEGDQLDDGGEDPSVESEPVRAERGSSPDDGEVTVMTVATSPGSGTVRINGVSFGDSPVKVGVDSIEFPAEIEVLHGTDVLATKEVGAPTQSVVVSLPYDPEAGLEARELSAARAAAVRGRARDFAPRVAVKDQPPVKPPRRVIRRPKKPNEDEPDPKTEETPTSEVQLPKLDQ